jgi:hypothetical protein
MYIRHLRKIFTLSVFDTVGEFSLLYGTQIGSWAHPAPYPPYSSSALLEIKPSGFEVEYSSLLPRLRFVKPPLSQNALMAWCLINHRDNCNLTLVRVISFFWSRLFYHLSLLLCRAASCYLCQLHTHLTLNFTGQKELPFAFS